MNEQQLQEVAMQPQYDYIPSDMVDAYGSIIKELTDPEKIVEEFRLKILGLRKTDEGKLVKIRDIKIDRGAVDEIVNLMRSIINQNTHFSSFDRDRVTNTLRALNYYINRYMMKVGDKIPLMYRANIAMEAMALAQASLFKAHESTILRWSKGQASDNRVSGSEKKSGWMSFLMPGRS